MCRKLLLLLPLVVLACKREPDARQSAISVKVAYDASFKQGCIVVLARDGQGKEARSEFKMATSGTPLDVAIYRQDDWGRDIEVTVSAFEDASCTGVQVDGATKSFSLKEAGIQRWEDVKLTTPDEDGDGYVATRAGGGGGSDCDDAHDKARPGLTEQCDGLDNDCKDGIDNGLTQSTFYLDADEDGVGAGQAVMACVAPPKHVMASGDCNDGNAEIAPGKLEVCDDVDNNCVGGVDEALPTKTYYRDTDGDGYGDGAQSLVSCRVPQGYVEKGPNAFDCADSDKDVHPNATEVCNDKDDNCVDGTDENFDKTWYRDEDGDGFGNQAVTLTSCTPPAGYVKARAEGFDCEDAPGKEGVNPNAQEWCDGVDNNCKDGKDEGFNLGPCTKDTCTGQRTCTPDGKDSVCSAQPPTLYAPDRDGDGEGSSAPADVVKICTGDTVPGGVVLGATDCDDQDPHNFSGGTEICDDRDNNCANGKTDEQGAGNVCGTKGWKAVTDTGLSSSVWNTVAVGAGGYPVWIAGDSGALAVRASAGTAFTTYLQKCGNVHWQAAWVRPSDGTVFLAGAGGNLAAYKAGDATCAMITTESATGGTTSNKSLQGLKGFESGTTTTVYAVNVAGQMFEWTGVGAPAFRFTRSPASVYLGLHGVSATELLLAGNEPSNEPLLHTYDTSSTSGIGSATHTLSGVPSGYKGQVTRVWAMDATHAYAVGKGGLVLKRTGATTWDYVNPGGVTTDLIGLAAIDDSSVYVSDASSQGVIRRLTPNSWVTHFNGTGLALRDLTVYPGTTTWDIWAVGIGGTVIHFPE